MKKSLILFAVLMVLSITLSGCLEQGNKRKGKEPVEHTTTLKEQTQPNEVTTKPVSDDQYSPEDGITPVQEQYSTGNGGTSEPQTNTGGPPTGTYECVQVTGDLILSNYGQQPTSGTFFGYLTLFEDGSYEEAYTRDASEEYTASGNYTHDPGTGVVSFDGTFQRWGWSGEYIAPQTASDRHAVVLRGEEDGTKIQIWCGEEN